MSDRNFSRRRRGMRFRPSGGLGHVQQRSDRDAIQARAEVVGEQAAQEKVYERRHAHEIERAENIAAGLPPEGVKQPAPESVVSGKRDFREPHMGIPAEVQEEERTFAPVPVPEQPKGIVESIRAVATNLVNRVHRMIKPVKRAHKEVIINAETLETRVAVLEEGRLEEFNIERTTEERLVGSIFKGKVRNLEDGLKAAFVDIGFEKNAFLHYWDIVPSNFDSGVEIVEREGRRRDKPKITQKDIPRVYPPGSDIIVQVTKGPIGTKGPRVTTNIVLPGRYLVLLPNSDQSGISRKIENQPERHRLKKILRELSIPEGMGVIMRTVGESQQKRYFVRDLALLLEEWREIQERIKKQPT
jgi:ribonuclease G